ncbi:MAG: UDP-glucose--hexose-1-phosphate uridylyltransferase [Phyllobacteriaceae bacterium]|nr:UDP-glucose--hexose-1-phosphate uridylyltransferase [Phyllobacteriaceae bacterium]
MTLDHLAWTTAPHRRLNPLTGERVLVSPHRMGRPWQGQTEAVASTTMPAHDPSCYLCPGNTRVGGIANPNYDGTFVFDNDFAALLPDTPAGGTADDELFVAEAESGVCRVVCFSPRHDLTLAGMSVDDIRRVVETWIGQSAELGARDDVVSVQIFENRGAVMGCSNPHPHGQIWASRHLPDEPAKEDVRQRDYFARHGRPMLLDYVERELAAGDRIVHVNDRFVVLVPFWAVWPFEKMILPRRSIGGFDELEPADTQALAEALSAITRRYDALFRVSFPYSMGFHQKPLDGKDHPGWVMHAHFYPPLLRSATVKKFMVGFEMLGSPQRDLTAEAAAERLRAVSGEPRPDAG